MDVDEAPQNSCHQQQAAPVGNQQQHRGNSIRGVHIVSSAHLERAMNDCIQRVGAFSTYVDYSLTRCDNCGVTGTVRFRHRHLDSETLGFVTMEPYCSNCDTTNDGEASGSRSSSFTPSIGGIQMVGNDCRYSTSPTKPSAPPLDVQWTMSLGAFMASLTATQLSRLLKSIGYSITDTLRRNASRLFKWRLTPIILKTCQEKIRVNQKLFSLPEGVSIDDVKSGRVKDVPRLIFSIDGRYDSSRHAQWATVTAICTSTGLIVAQRTYMCGTGGLCELETAYHAEKTAIKEILEELKQARIIVDKVVHDDCKTLTKFVNDEQCRNLLGEPIENGLDIFHACKNFKKKVAKYFGKDASVNRVRFIEVPIKSLKADMQDVIGENLVYKLMEEDEDFEFPSRDERERRGMKKQEMRQRMCEFLRGVDAPYILIPVAHTFTTQPFAESVAVDMTDVDIISTTSPDVPVPPSAPTETIAATQTTSATAAQTTAAQTTAAQTTAAQTTAAQTTAAQTTAAQTTAAQTTAAQTTADGSDEVHVDSGHVDETTTAQNANDEDASLSLRVHSTPFKLDWCKAGFKSHAFFKYLKTLIDDPVESHGVDTTKVFIRLVGRQPRMTKQDNATSLKNRQFIDVSIGNLKANVADVICNEFLYKMMRDDEEFNFDESLAKAKQRDLSKVFLASKCDTVFVLIPMHSEFLSPGLSELRATATKHVGNAATSQRPSARITRFDSGADTIPMEHISDDFVLPIENDDDGQQNEYEFFLSHGAISMSWLSGSGAKSASGRQLEKAIDTESAKVRSSVLVRLVGAKTRGSAGKTTANQICLDHLRLVYGGGDAWFESTKQRIGRHYFHCCANPENDTPDKLLTAMCNFAKHLTGDHEHCSKREGKGGCTEERQKHIEEAMKESRSKNAAIEDDLKLQVHLFVDTVLEMDNMMKRIPRKERSRMTRSWDAYKDRDRIPTDKCQYLIDSFHHSSSANESFHRQVNRHAPKDTFFRSSMKARIGCATLEWCELKELHLREKISPREVRQLCLEAYERGGRDEMDKELKRINHFKQKLRRQSLTEDDYSLHIQNQVRNPNTMSHREALLVLKENKLIDEGIASLMDIPDAKRFYTSIQHLEECKR